MTLNQPPPPMQPGGSPPPPPMQPVEPQPPRLSGASPTPTKPWWKKRWGIAAIAVGVLVVLGAIGSLGGGSSEPTASPTSAAGVATETTSSAPAATTTPAEPTLNPTPTPDAAESAPASEATVSPEPAAKPITLRGKGSRKTKPFVMASPARVNLTFTGSGNFISSIVPVGGDTFDGVSLSNTIGKTKLTTYVYDLDLDGVRSYAETIASSGSWTIEIIPGVPQPLAAPAEFSGKWGLRTRLVSLSGDYTAKFTHKGRGNFIVWLVPVGGSLFDGESIANEIGKVKDSTEAYGLDGDYYFEVMADGAWTITIAGQN